MLNTRTRRAAVAAATLTGVLALAACGGGDDTAGGTDDPIEFWGWNPAYAQVVDRWNETHDRKVVYETTPSGSKGGYSKMQAAVTAKNGPCLAQIGNESIASFVLEDMLMDITDQVASIEDAYPEASWSVMRVGDGTYGVPVDSAPVALFYRADVYERFGIQPATTWAEFAEQSAAVHAADPQVWLSSFSPTDSGWWGSLTQQAGGTWFSIDGDSWKVSIDSPQTQALATYWQALVDQGLTKMGEADSPEWYEDLQEGRVASHVAPVWWAGILEGAAGNSSGQWRVAPLPNTDPAKPSTGTNGGSATAVLSGCSDPAGAVEVANWMSTDPDAVQILIDESAIFPASTAGQQHAALDTEVEFYGGQKIFEVFVAANDVVDPSWTWGPMTKQTGTGFTDAMQGVSTGSTTLAKGLAAAQASAMAALESKGLSVSD